MMNVKKSRVLLSLALLCGLQQVSRAIPAPIARAIEKIQKENDREREITSRKHLREILRQHIDETCRKSVDDKKLKEAYSLTRTQFDRVIQKVVDRSERLIGSWRPGGKVTIAELTDGQWRFFQDELEKARINALLNIPDKDKAPDNAWSAFCRWLSRS